MDTRNPGEMMDATTRDARESRRQEPLYGGFTRFELELEVGACLNVIQQLAKMPVQFVQCLGNPWYLNHLATQKLFDNQAFLAYLSYLQYFAQPEYAKYLIYPGPTLKALQLLQQEKFRQDILSPETVARMIEANLRAIAGPSITGGANASIRT